MREARWRCGIAVLVAVALGATVVMASEVEHFRVHSQKGFLLGTLDGMSVDPLGTLRLAAAAERVASVPEPFLLSAAPHPEGWVVGTGNEGRVLLVARDGTVSELFQCDEPEVFAVWVDSDGTVFAAGSPGGSVYRIVGGEGRLFASSGETYVWQMGRDASGQLLLATGTQGRLLAVDDEGQVTVRWDSEDTHVRSFAVLGDGTVLAGTAGEGLLVRLRPDGRVETLHDAAQPEIVAVVPGEGGDAWAAAVASEASVVDLSPTSSTSEKKEDESASEAVTITAGPTTIGSRPAGFEGDRSELLRVGADGVVERVASLAEDTVFALAWHGGRVWLGTGLDGELYSFDGEELVLEKDVDERQIVAVLDGRELAFAATNSAAVYRFGGGLEAEGSYTSSVLDAGQVARFGTFVWRGETPDGAELAFSVRSGRSGEPDETWAEWVGIGSGAELSLASVPAGRYVQWRAVAARGRSGGSPSLTAVELSYLQRNLRPTIATMEVLAPGEVLVPSNFTPGQQVFELYHPAEDGVFTTLGDATSTSEARTKNLWKQGFRTVKWTGTDPNGDTLRYRLEAAPEGQDVWLLVAEELEEEYLSFDSTTLPDGIYRLRLVATDARSNPEGEALEATHVSEPVVVDHLAPDVVAVDSSGTTWRVTVRDELNALREASLSIDGGGWHELFSDDGLTDGRTERFTLDVPAGARLVMLRVADVAANHRTFDLRREASR